MSLRRWLLPIVAILIVAGPHAAMADPIAEAVKAKRAGDFARAVQILRPLAEKGDPRAQYELGNMYEYGDTPSKAHITEQMKVARKWYERSAAQNYKPGKRALGLYLINRGIDAMRGYRILLALAEAGDARAQAILGYHLAEQAKIDYPQRLRIPGTGAEGLAWLHKAVNQKDASAAFFLRLYHFQYGTVADTYYWELVAAAMMKARLPMTIPPIQDKLTKKQRGDIERRAAAWLTAHDITPVHRVEAK